MKKITYKNPHPIGSREWAQYICDNAFTHGEPKRIVCRVFPDYWAIIKEVDATPEYRKRFPNIYFPDQEDIPVLSDRESYVPLPIGNISSPIHSFSWASYWANLYTKEFKLYYTSIRHSNGLWFVSDRFDPIRVIAGVSYDYQPMRY